MPIINNYGMLVTEQDGQDREGSGMAASSTIAKGARVTGAQRDKIGDKFAKQYGTPAKPGKSIREIADEHGRSYGFVHRVLSERSDVTIRGRGGAARKVSGGSRSTRSAKGAKK